MTLDNSNTIPLDYTNEEWGDMPEWEGLYIISNFGRCKRVAPRSNGMPLPNKIMTPSKSGWKSSYLVYGLAHSGRRKTMYAHRAVMLAFVGLPPNDTYQVNHKDGDKHNNFIENLEWCTPVENQQHRYNELGQSQNGMDNPANKYHQDQIQEVIDLFSTGRYTQREVAKLTGINYKYVNQIVHGKTWRHLRVSRDSQ